MPLSIADLSLGERTFDAEWNGHKFSVTYRPNAFTSKFQADYKRQWNGSATDAEDAAWWISRVVTAWDVQDEKGKPLPLTEEWLATQDLFDVQFLWGLIRQIQDDRRPKATTSDAPSAGTSSLV